MNYSDIQTIEITTLLISLLITVFAYLLVPTIICLSKKKFSLSKIKKIAITNAICVAFIFIFINVANGETSASPGGLIWGYVAYWLMKKKCLEEDGDDEDNDEYGGGDNNDSSNSEDNKECEDITESAAYSLSNENEEQKKYGNYNIYSEDVMYHPKEENGETVCEEYEAPAHKETETISEQLHNPIDTSSNIEIDPSHSQEQGSNTPLSRKRINIAIPILSVLLCLSCSLCLVFHFQKKKAENQYSSLTETVTKLKTEKTVLTGKNSDLNKKIAEYEYAVSYLTERKTTLDKKLSELSGEISQIKYKLDFFDKYIVFVLDDETNWYHRYECELFEGTFWAYNIEAAILRNYKPCPLCCGD